MQTEKYLRASGLDYTIVRPGGLKNDPPSAVGNLILRNEDTLFAKQTDPGTSISRETVRFVVLVATHCSSWHDLSTVSTLVQIDAK